MSAIGTKQTSLVAPHMSAFGGKADMQFGRLLNHQLLVFDRLGKPLYLFLSAPLDLLVGGSHERTSTFLVVETKCCSNNSLVLNYNKFCR